MSWVRPDSWLTYLSLDAPYDKVTYDLTLTSRDVITIMPFGHALLNPAAVSNAGDSSLPRLPMGTPEIALAALIVLLALGGMVWIVRGFQRPQV
jgi:hypothetical protein